MGDLVRWFSLASRVTKVRARKHVVRSGVRKKEIMVT